MLRTTKAERKVLRALAAVVEKDAMADVSAQALVEATGLTEDELRGVCLRLQGIRLLGVFFPDDKFTGVRLSTEGLQYARGLTREAMLQRWLRWSFPPVAAAFGTFAVRSALADQFAWLSMFIGAALGLAVSIGTYFSVEH